MPAGVDINAPENGRVMPAFTHRIVHARGYNPDWNEYLQNRPSPSQIRAFRDNVMIPRYGLDAYPRPVGRYPDKYLPDEY